MKLAKYLMFKGLSQSEASRQLGITQVAVNHYLNRKSVPSGRMMIKIFQWSKGKVNLSDWSEEFPNAE